MIVLFGCIKIHLIFISEKAKEMHLLGGKKGKSSTIYFYCFLIFIFVLPISLTFLSSGLEEVMEFLEQSFPNVEIAIAHGKVLSSFA